ncbi:MAG: FAD-dependent oxidoreductase, partial [Acidimicrobiales bacterium]|nr:FAD-dependent oxidoreductase [Acidimicrobiales bacterium]
MTRKRFVIIGGGPGGNQCATHAARLGAQVTLVERDIVGGAAHLWDCIPSKAMIATGDALSLINHSRGMGLSDVSATLDFGALRDRIQAIEHKLQESVTSLLKSQGVCILQGTGRLHGPHSVVVEGADGTTTELDADVIVLATGSRPRIPDWAPVDGKRVLTTRDAYPPPELPDHLVVIGAGVTGVEFVHMFSSFGCDVTFIVSRQQVLPQKDPEVAAALEEDFLDRGVRLLKGARATGIEVRDDDITVICDDGRRATGSHALLAVGSIPNSEELGLDQAGV